MTITRAQIRAELYDTVPGLGFSGTATAAATTSITDTYALKDTTLGANHYRGTYIYRPLATTSSDVVRKANTLAPTTGVLTHSGGNYTDVTTFGYELVGPLHPDELNACITRAMRFVYFEVQLPLCGLVVNGDMENGATGWTGTNATPTAITTASKVFSGTNALRVANSGANGYAASGTFTVFPNEPFYASSVCQVTSGTASFQMYDNTNSAIIGSAITSVETNFAHLWCMGNIPSTCHTASIRLSGVEASADVAWNHALAYRTSQLVLPAQSWLDEQYKLLKLREAKYSKNLSAQANGGYDDAQSRHFDDWFQPSMYSLDPFKLDTNPYNFQLTRAIPRNELWVEAKRPYYDVETMATEAATTHAPLNLVAAYARMELAKVLKVRYPSDPRWKELAERTQEDVSAEFTSRPEVPTQPIKLEYYGRA